MELQFYTWAEFPHSPKGTKATHQLASPHNKAPSQAIKISKEKPNGKSKGKSNSKEVVVQQFSGCPTTSSSEPDPRRIEGLKQVTTYALFSVLCLVPSRELLRISGEKKKQTHRLISTPRSKRGSVCYL